MDLEKLSIEELQQLKTEIPEAIKRKELKQLSLYLGKAKASGNLDLITIIEAKIIEKDGIKNPLIKGRTIRSLTVFMKDFVSDYEACLFRPKEFEILQKVGYSENWAIDFIIKYDENTDSCDRDKNGKLVFYKVKKEIK